MGYYYTEVLRPGEQVHFMARLHWQVYLMGLKLLAGALLVALLASMVMADNGDPRHVLLVVDGLTGDTSAQAFLVMLHLVGGAARWLDNVLSSAGPMGQTILSAMAMLGTNGGALLCGILWFGALNIALAGVLSMGGAAIRRTFTEMVITDRRIICRRGVLMRRVTEINLSMVVEVQIVQGTLGRLLGFGDLLVYGGGLGFEVLKGVSEPVAMRNSIPVPGYV